MTLVKQKESEVAECVDAYQLLSVRKEAPTIAVNKKHALQPLIKVVDLIASMWGSNPHLPIQQTAPIIDQYLLHWRVPNGWWWGRIIGGNDE